MALDGDEQWATLLECSEESQKKRSRRELERKVLLFALSRNGMALSM